MADNVGYTPGTGATIAADEIGGVLHQRVKVSIGDDGSATDVSETNPMPVEAQGELVEAIEALRMAVVSLTRSIGIPLPNAQGQQIVEVRQTSSSLLSVGVASGGLTSVNSVGSLTNQSQMGGYSANDYIPALMHMQADNLRRNITVS